SGTAMRALGESSDATLAEKAMQVERLSEKIRENFELAASSLLDRYRNQMAAYGEQKYSEARDFHSRELAAAIEASKIERDAQARDWYEKLARANEESLQKYGDELHGTSDLWMNAAVARLNETGETAL